MKKKPTNKILKDDLSALISKYSKSNVLDELAKSHFNSPVQIVPTKNVKDNEFVSKVTLSKKIISHFVENYQRNILLEPLVVRAKDENYEVIIGRKRLAAAKLTKVEEIPVIVMNYNDEETLLILLAKARDSLESNPLELAYIFAKLAQKYHYSHESLAKLSFKSRSQVTNIIRLLKLDNNVLAALNNYEISFGHARALIGIEQSLSDNYLMLIKETNISVRELEYLINNDNARNNEGQKEKIIQNKNKVTVIFESSEEATDFIDKLRKSHIS